MTTDVPVAANYVSNRPIQSSLFYDSPSEPAVTVVVIVVRELPIGPAGVELGMVQLEIVEY